MTRFIDANTLTVQRIKDWLTINISAIDTNKLKIKMAGDMVIELETAETLTTNQKNAVLAKFTNMVEG